jgi:hypothetical protein
MGYPLPRSSQENYTKYFQKVIQKGTLENYKILWVGSPLPCRFKSNETKQVLGPSHVFIAKKDETFEYAIMDNKENVFKLPKKFFTLCFPNLSINSIPENNRVEYQITEKQKVTLPYIPDTFLQQKRTKTNRKRRKIYHNVESPPTERDVESIDFSRERVPSWFVLQKENNENQLLKKQVVLFIRSIIGMVDSSSFVLEDPFDRVSNVKELHEKEEYIEKMKIITSFIFHYCREELGIHRTNDNMLKNAEAFVANLSA